MPFDETTLLAGLRVLGPRFSGIDSIVGLQQKLRFELPQYAGEERVVNRGIVDAVRDLRGQVSEALPSRQRIGDPREYWRDVWVLLYLTEHSLRQLEADPAAPVTEVARLFEYLNHGVAAFHGTELIFKDRAGVDRRFRIDQNNAHGWRERVATRPLVLADAVQVGTSPHDFSRFEALFGQVAPGVAKPQAIQEKRRLLDECLNLEQKHWDALK